MTDAVARVDVVRLDGATAKQDRDAVVREEPLEIQLQGASLAVVMRTPGHDEELALGFLVTERVVSSAADVVSVRHCTRAPVPEAEDNVLQVRLRAGVPVDLERLRRNVYANSSCGVCGKATIENVMSLAAPPGVAPRVTAATLRALPSRLREAQRVFDETGGLHAAALFDAGGRLLVVREDIGRHNAVDKIAGWALRQGLTPLGDHVLMVSGRASFEIVQKAAAAGIPVVAAVSAASSLAVETARALNMTLVAFLRGDTMNVYAGSVEPSGSKGRSSSSP